MLCNSFSALFLITLVMLSNVILFVNSRSLIEKNALRISNMDEDLASKIIKKGNLKEDKEVDKEKINRDRSNVLVANSRSLIENIALKALNLSKGSDSKTIGNKHLSRRTTEKQTCEKLHHGKLDSTSDGYIENCLNGSKIATKQNKRCPYEDKKLCLIFSLSQIARVEVASSSKTTAHSTLNMNLFGNVPVLNTAKDSIRIAAEAKNSRANFAEEKDQGKRLPDLGKMRSSNVVHCRATEDVYIAAAKQNLPAFTCKLDNNTFVLSSERFLQDRRSHFDLRIDADALKNLKFTPRTSRSNEINVLPALLVLNVARNDYRIEVHRNYN